MAQLLLPEQCSKPVDSNVQAPYFYGDIPLEIDESGELDDVPTGLQDIAEVSNDLEHLLAAASPNRLPNRLYGKLRDLVLSYQDIFRNKMGLDSLPAFLQ